MKGQRWTPAESRQLTEMWESGMPLADMSSELGRSPASIHERRRTLGLPSRTPDAARPGRADHAQRIDQAERARALRESGLSEYEVRRLAGL